MNPFYISRKDLQNLLIGEAFASALLLILFIIYFPSRPRIPPSRNSGEERDLDPSSREPFMANIRRLVSNRQLWLINISYSVSNGFQAAWQGIMAVNLEPLGVSDSDVGRVGFINILGMTVAACIVAFTLDSFRHHIKPAILGLQAVA